MGYPDRQAAPDFSVGRPSPAVDDVICDAHTAPGPATGIATALQATLALWRADVAVTESGHRQLELLTPSGDQLQITVLAGDVAGRGLGKVLRRMVNPPSQRVYGVRHRNQARGEEVELAVVAPGNGKGVSCVYRLFGHYSLTGTVTRTTEAIADWNAWSMRVEKQITESQAQPRQMIRGQEAVRVQAKLDSALHLDPRQLCRTAAGKTGTWEILVEKFTQDWCVNGVSVLITPHNTRITTVRFANAPTHDAMPELAPTDQLVVQVIATHDPQTGRRASVQVQYAIAGGEPGVAWRFAMPPPAVRDSLHYAIASQVTRDNTIFIRLDHG